MSRHVIIPGILFVLALLSLVTLRSIDAQLVTRQAWSFLVGAGLFFGVTRVSFSDWVRWSIVLYAAMIIALVATLLIGQVTRGTVSWIDVGIAQFQPAQMALPIVSLTVAAMLLDQKRWSWRRVFFWMCMIGLPAGLIFIEPEVGITVIYLVALFAMSFVTSLSWKHVVAVLLSALVGVLVLWVFVLRPYQKTRIASFLHPSEHTQEASYNAQQAMIAIGSGQLLGRGIGQGIQSHLRFLPERQTDFIFASFAEEMGFLGAGTVVGLYGVLIFFLLWVAAKETALDSRGFVTAAAIMVTAQVGINIGMNSGLLPITGITLPFFSYGGSSIIAVCFQLGCVQAVVLRQHRVSVLQIR